RMTWRMRCRARDGDVPIFVELRDKVAARGSRYSPPREVASLGSGVRGLPCHEACPRRSRFVQRSLLGGKRECRATSSTPASDQFRTSRAFGFGLSVVLL